MDAQTAFILIMVAAGYAAFVVHLYEAEHRAKHPPVILPKPPRSKRKEVWRICLGGVAKALIIFTFMAAIYPDMRDDH